MEKIAKFKAKDVNMDREVRAYKAEIDKQEPTPEEICEYEGHDFSEDYLFENRWNDITETHYTVDVARRCDRCGHVESFNKQDN